MRPSTTDPTRLDVVAFAKAGGQLQGSTDVGQLARLGGSTVVPADGATQAVAWRVEGLCNTRAGREPEVRLHIVATCKLWLQCQRCLQPMAQVVAVDGLFRFVAGEDQAARLDEESEEDVLVLPRALKLDDLIEDELILALPIVPRHAECPQPIGFASEAAADYSAPEAPANPFAALAGFKLGKPNG